MCHQIVLRPHSHVLKHNINSVWLFLHSSQLFSPCKIHYRIKRVYTGRGNKLQRWGERVIVKITLPIPALKLTWGLLKLQPDIRLDKDARKGPYVATGDYPSPLFHVSLSRSLFPTLNLSGVQCLRGPLDASEQEVPSDQTSSVFTRLPISHPNSRSLTHTCTQKQQTGLYLCPKHNINYRRTGETL